MVVLVKSVEVGGFLTFGRPLGMDQLMLFLSRRPEFHHGIDFKKKYAFYF